MSAQSDHAADALIPIEESIWIRANPARVFHALADGGERAHWWPESAHSEFRLDGKLVLVWSPGNQLETRFDCFVPEREIGYAFYCERLRFALKDEVQEAPGTTLDIQHLCGPDAVIHVAQCWGFLKAALKCWIEHGIDLRK